MNTQATIQAAIAGLVAMAPAHAAAPIPDYFFSQWTVTANCTEASAGPAARVKSGLQFKIASDSTAAGRRAVSSGCTSSMGARRWTCR